jgi:hypothetical protein
MNQNPASAIDNIREEVRVTGASFRQRQPGGSKKSDRDERASELPV